MDLIVSLMRNLNLTISLQFSPHHYLSLTVISSVLSLSISLIFSTVHFIPYNPIFSSLSHIPVSLLQSSLLISFSFVSLIYSTLIVSSYQLLSLYLPRHSPHLLTPLSLYLYITHTKSLRLSCPLPPTRLPTTPEHPLNINYFKRLDPIVSRVLRIQMRPPLTPSAHILWFRPYHTTHSHTYIYLILYILWCRL